MRISKTLLVSAEQHRLTLRFKNKRLEHYYLRHSLPSLRRQARVALLLGSAMYWLNGFLDAFINPYNVAVKLWWVHGVVITIVLIVLALTFNKRFSRNNQTLLLMVALSGGAGVLVVMMFVAEESTKFYYAALVLVAFWTHCLSGLRFTYASFVSLFTLLAFNVLFLWLHPLLLLDMICYNFYIVSANIVAASSSYLSERKSRVLFLREKELDSERYLQHQRALHDRLTELPNRELLMDRIEQSLNYALRHNQVGAGFFLDLDRFKPVNDRYGHAVGDIVLQEVANRLKRVIREADTLCRLGGDEFFILAQNIETELAANTLAQKLSQCFQAPFVFKNIPPINDLSISIGICMFPYKNATADDIVRRADQAMYKIKRAEKSRQELSNT